MDPIELQAKKNALLKAKELAKKLQAGQLRKRHGIELKSEGGPNLLGVMNKKGNSAQDIVDENQPVEVESGEDSGPTLLGVMGKKGNSAQEIVDDTGPSASEVLGTEPEVTSAQKLKESDDGDEASDTSPEELEELLKKFA